MAGPEKKLFKDWFDADAAARLAQQMRRAYPAFDAEGFQGQATSGLKHLEFHGRIQLFADALRAHLPDAVPEALDILVRSLPPLLPDCESVTDGWLQWPLGVWIADHGVPHLDDAFRAMEALTQRFSSEFAVRPFLIAYPDDCFRRLLALSTHPSAHVRRWCSEGTRPRLPWGKRIPSLIEDPSPALPILEALCNDPEPYVRRSVANHVNDIAKDHPEIARDICRRWMKHATPERAALVRHALRSLIKDGDPDALRILDFPPPKNIEIDFILYPKALQIGDSLEIKAQLRNAGSQAASLALDYKLHFARPGGRASAKVFKWTTLTLQPGETRTFVKRHPMRHASIRQLHPGEHHIELQLNGQKPAQASFRLEM
jgi:3-methyladenine DNA glycosylase AlkC